MRWKTTWVLLLSAAVLFGFIYFVDQRLSSSNEPPPPPSTLVSIKPEEITAIQVRRTNQFLLRADRTNQSWMITAPINYPAQSEIIEHLLKSLSELTSYTYITPQELRTGGKSVAEFGLDVPATTLTLVHNGRRTELLFGAPTPAGDLAYFQLLSTPGIYLISAEILARLPRTANDWRDQTLINLEGVNADRLEVRSLGRGFAIQTTNGQFYLTKPTPARADRIKVDALLRKLQTERVNTFVVENAKTELEEFGFQTPQAEVDFGVGTNDVVVVQFGKNASNDMVYARRLLNNNIVLVSHSLVDALQVSAADLRDRHLLSFNPATIDLIEVSADENFTIRRQGADTWSVGEPQPFLADSDLVRECLSLMRTAEAEVEKDVVTDFAVYGLAEPIRQYLLKAAATNSSDTASNRLVGRLDIGGRRNGKVFARGPENTVYAVDPRIVDRLPVAAWQLRDRRVWSFTTNQVAGLTLRRNGTALQLLRGPMGEWKFESGSSGIINTFAVEESVHRLGELRAAIWVDRGEGKRQLYGFRENGDKLLIDVRNRDKSQVLSVEFGDFAPSGCPYALAVVDGQSWIFEFPLALYVQHVQRLLSQVSLPSTAKASL